MRSFKLINGNGAVFDLMRRDAFLYEPTGLGWGYETDYVDVGGAYIPTDTTLVHPEPSGTMIFKGYEQYDEFLQFIQVGGITLGYKPLNTWRYLDVSVVIDKSEISYETNRLACGISFSGLSLWYSGEKTYRAGSLNAYNSKKYTYKYDTDTPDGTAGYVYATTAGSAEISNGSLPSFCKITILGEAINPAWTLYDSMGQQIATGKVFATIPSGHMLVINSRPDDMEIAEYTVGGDRVANLYTSSDFSTERFVVIPAGSGYRMDFTDDGGLLGDCIVQVFERG